ncbi:hypothetical protein C4564_03505 [Candidatus Microgenomates bacterium]|nr:MAG: hypothetical protein C4564_03505 [Candidatus Microgenomates bacterium]
MLKKYKRSKIEARKIVYLVATLIAIPVVLILISRPSIFFPSAQSVQSQIILTSANNVMPPNSVVSLEVDTGTHQLGFAQVTLLFDKDKIQLASEIKPSDVLKTVVVKSTMQEANASGVIELSLGLATQDRGNAPTGKSLLATLQFTSKSSATNDTTLISIDQANSQIVDQTPQALTMSGANFEFTLNYVAPTAAPTNSPGGIQGSASPSSSPTQQPTEQPTEQPTSIPQETATARPTFVPGPTLPPTDDTQGGTPSQGNGQVTWTTQTAQDIANEDGSRYFDSGNSSNLFIGTGASSASSYLGIRFSGPSLSSTSNIKSAKVGISASRDQWIGVSFKVSAEKTKTPLAFSSGSRMSQRSPLTASKSYSDNIKWFGGEIYYYDVTEQVKEAVKASSGDVNSLALIFQGQGNAYGRKNIVSSGQNSPKLVVDYDGESSAYGGSVGGGSVMDPIVEPVQNFFTRFINFFRSRFRR